MWFGVSGGWLLLPCVTHAYNSGCSHLGHTHGLGPYTNSEDGPGPHTGQHSPSRWVVDIYHSHLVTCWTAFSSSQSFSQAICNLLSWTHILYLDNPSIQFFFDKESVNLHMFGSIMLNWVVCYVNCRLVVATIHSYNWSSISSALLIDFLSITTHSIPETWLFIQPLQLIWKQQVVSCFSKTLDFLLQKH